ncbi:T-cell receptor-associated transmembrane adapter 1 isoform X2 [Mixophyes fleayi]|uniref:T-cell receptor-associated transmembrane adapter 1 isoform X2 n=1 Tax=Mixophyes fleayi TaxID=3061075 RepID=UPI003F4DC247
MTKATDQCFELLVTSVIISLAFLLSLTFNIVHCVMKHRREKEMKFSSQHSISYDQQYMETNPIYGNLNQSILDHTDECCYEPMATPHERKRWHQRNQCSMQHLISVLKNLGKHERRKQGQLVTKVIRKTNLLVQMVIFCLHLAYT